MVNKKERKITMAKIKTFTDYDSERLDKEINEFLADKKLISIKTNVIVEPSNGYIDSRGYSTVKMFNYVVIYKEKEKEINPYEEDNKFMEEYFKNNPHLS